MKVQFYLQEHGKVLVMNSCIIKFEIIKKNDYTKTSDWIFNCKSSDLPHQDLLYDGHVIECDLTLPDQTRVVSQDLANCLQNAMNCEKLVQTLKQQSNNTPILNENMIPFMSSFSTC